MKKITKINNEGYFKLAVELNTVLIEAIIQTAGGIKMEVVPDFFIVKLPLPFKMDHVNCYLIRGNNGWSIIDTGLNYPPSTSLWEKTFENFKIKNSEIEGIYLSHLHPGHYGASGWLQELTGAPVYMIKTEIMNVDQTWKKGRTNAPVVGELFKENGMPPNLIADMLDNMAGMLNYIQPHPTLSQLPEGEKVDLGGRWFDVVPTPGHSDGHISFFNDVEGILISGDHLLPASSSSISLWPTSHPNPLELFIDSLKCIGNLPVKMVLPAHGPVFYNCCERVTELLDYHHDRLGVIADLAGSGATAYQICVRLLGGSLSLSEIRFALTEILAYLAFLQSRSMVNSRLEGGIVNYRKV